jgi:REP element-mobilizing transposase RayT
MNEYESVSQSRWECKYHVVFIPKFRRKVLYVSLRKHLGAVFSKLAEQKESRIEEGHLLADHIHMMLSIPLKMRCRPWWDSSKARAQSMGHECMGSGNRIMQAKVSGRVVISYRR